MKSKETKLHEAAVRYADCLRKEVSPEPERASTFHAWDRLKRAARDYSNALAKEKSPVVAMRSSTRSVGRHAPECIRTAHWQPDEGRYVDVSCTCGAIGKA